jgi:hypothetical protein
MDSELEETWKKESMTQLMILSSHLLLGTEKSHEDLTEGT